jgi:hypothetical protein
MALSMAIFISSTYSHSTIILGILLNLSIVIFHTSIKAEEEGRAEEEKKLRWQFVVTLRGERTVVGEEKRFLCIAHGDVGSNKNVIRSRAASEIIYMTIAVFNGG